MLRPNSLRLLVAPVLILAMAVMVGCGGSGEEKTTLQKYFNASKMRDNLTLANIATVGFDPTKDGQVQTFGIVSTAPEQVVPLALKQHQAELKTAQDAETEFGKKKREYQDANGEAIERILKAEGKNQTLKGKDAQIQTEWTKWRDETQTYAKKVSDARKLINAERPVVEISIQDARNPVNVTDYDGDVVSKDVTIDAKVKLPDGTTTNKILVFTIQRATLTGVVGQDGKPGSLVGRWVITKFVEAGK